MKAVGLLSGGLDSTLAVQIMLDQGIEVVAVNFTSPFCLCNRGGTCHSAAVANRFGLEIHTVRKGVDYLEIVRHPKHGYGSAVNPCIDCRIYMLRKTKELAGRIKAAFIFTGEVVGQRPMSQHFRALEVIEREAGLEGKILRPLSAKLLPETEAEKMGLVDRNRLLAIRGRSRKEQMALAKDYGIADYPCPSGGCLLTDRNFAKRLKDLFDHKRSVTFRDIELLKVGRHFRFSGQKIIVGRDERENKILVGLRNEEDTLVEASEVKGPVTLLPGGGGDEVIHWAAELTAAYSDAEQELVAMRYEAGSVRGEITVSKGNRKEAYRWII